MTACTMCSRDGESSPRAPAARVEQAAAVSALETRVSNTDTVNCSLQDPGAGPY